MYALLITRHTYKTITNNKANAPRPETSNSLHPEWHMLWHFNFVSMDTVRNIVLNVNITLDATLVSWYSIFTLFLCGAFLSALSTLCINFHCTFICSLGCYMTLSLIYISTIMSYSLCFAMICAVFIMQFYIAF